MQKNKPQLISPAGDWPSLRSAVEAGCDCVYFGVKGLNMRNRADNFDLLELGKVMEFLHGNEKKGYLALNVIVMDGEIKKVRKILETAKEAAVDGVILWDMAVFSIAKELGLNIHISTQGSVSNIEALSFFSKLGAHQAVLARECTLENIKGISEQIQKQGIPCQLEAFIHGAMCVSISGRCFLSQYTFSKSANRGECLQPCRREYDIIDKEGEANYTLGCDYVLSPKDLCTIDFLDQLIEAKIGSFKIEGRKRSPEYIKVVTSVYRRAIDAFFDGALNAALKSKLKDELSNVYNRGFSSGFYLGRPGDDVSRKLQHNYEKVYIGEVAKFFKKISVAEILIQNESLKQGQEVLFIGKNTPACFTTVEQLQQNHAFVSEVSKGERVGVKLAFTVRRKDKVFLWRKK
ncbi:MAG: U32 family peptidase [Candidatus Omnitrophica bacterium]|nr:U32 family peptidase [Candidatus Omnitrophota bacterium]